MCVEAMRENQARLGKKVVIPWRESKLTMLLQPYFEHGQAVRQTYRLSRRVLVD